MDTASRSASPAEQQPLAEYFAAQVEIRLRRVAFELRSARLSMDEDRVHDLRVAIRRMMETLRVARGVLPEEGCQKTLKDLRKIMRAAADVRNCDIARDLLEKAGAPADAEAMVQLHDRRSQAEADLYVRTHRAYQRSLTQVWRSALRLGKEPR